MSARTPVLDAIRDLDVRFRLHDGEVHAVKGIDLDVSARRDGRDRRRVRLGQEPDGDGGDGAARLERQRRPARCAIAARS